MSNFERINDKLFDSLFTAVPEQLERILEEKGGDIASDFLGFVDTYFYLSKIIPTHWGIFDLGCASAPQAFYFRKHKFYIGVDVDNPWGRFEFRNTRHIKSDIKILNPDILLDEIGEKDTPYFAILNYVPLGGQEIKEVIGKYNNMFSFYPQGDEKTVFSPRKGEESG